MHPAQVILSLSCHAHQSDRGLFLDLTPYWTVLAKSTDTPSLNVIHLISKMYTRCLRWIKCHGVLPGGKDSFNLSAFSESVTHSVYRYREQRTLNFVTSPDFLIFTDLASFLLAVRRKSLISLICFGCTDTPCQRKLVYFLEVWWSRNTVQISWRPRASTVKTILFTLSGNGSAEVWAVNAEAKTYHSAKAFQDAFRTREGCRDGRLNVNILLKRKAWH